MELEKIVAANITELRKSKQWTQLELAEKLNYSDKSISKWERGDGIPDLKTLCKMAELFSVSLDFFVTDGASEQLKKYAAPKEEKGYKYKRMDAFYLTCAAVVCDNVSLQHKMGQKMARTCLLIGLLLDASCGVLSAIFKL